PDASTLIQLGLLHGCEGQWAEAEQQFAAAMERAPGSYKACYNLLMTRLTLGKIDLAESLVPNAIQLAPNDEHRRRFQLLHALLQACQAPSHEVRSDTLLKTMTAADEEQLLAFLRTLGHLDTLVQLLRALLDRRPASSAVRAASFEVTLLKAKSLFDRGDWLGAERLLLPVAGDTEGATRVAYLNLLGCCACLCQNYLEGVQHFKAALRLNGSDPQLLQNLALAYEWQGQHDQAEPHWSRYLQLIDHQVPESKNYLSRLAFEGCNRLAALWTEKERWSTALSYGERALHLRPHDPDALERQFHLTIQAQRREDARRILERLRHANPDDPQHDVFALELIDTHDAAGIEHLVTETERVLKDYPEDSRVQTRGHLLLDH